MMGQKDKRQRLKDRFQNGALPSQGDFSVLIDSFVHVDEFSEWTRHGVVEVGADNQRRWRFQCDDGRQLVVRLVPGGERTPGTVSPEDLAQLRIDAWVGMPARRGTYQPPVAGTTPDDTTPDGGPPGTLHVKADGNWHSIIRAVSTCAAFEVVAQTAQGGVAEGGALTRALQGVGIKAPTSGVAHGIAVAAGRGTVPSLSMTLAPSRRRRTGLWGASAIATAISSLLAVYAAFRTPGTRCGAQWGIGCIPELIDAQGPLLAGAALVLVLAVGIVTTIWATRSNCLQLAWRKSSQGDTYDLCVRAPMANDGRISYHLTRLW